MFLTVVDSFKNIVVHVEYTKKVASVKHNNIIVTDLTKPLPGNSSVSMFKRATIEECHRC
jgi:hypothetical protein